jgi:hypothetical protein
MGVFWKMDLLVQNGTQGAFGAFSDQTDENLIDCSSEVQKLIST